jgi:hypothetical protein
MLALVVNGKTRPPPPVARMTALAPIASIRPDISSIATTPRTRPSSTSNRVAYHSSYRISGGYFSEVWKSVCSRWKPVLSAANQVRFFFMPPKARTATCPSGVRLHGQPQCSRRSSSARASGMNISTASWSQSQSPPEIVSYACSSKLSSAPIAAAAPPSAETVWLRIG